LTLLALLPGWCRADEADALARGIQYLSRAVPEWPRENKCHSCHNNGDAARALYRAVEIGDAIPAGVLEENDVWLRHPERWQAEKGDEPFHDAKLARLQFTLALSAAFQAKRIEDRTIIDQAVDTIAREQDDQGAWSLVSPDDPGSPTTYGRALASALIVEMLRQTDEVRYRPHITKTRDWFLARPIVSVLDASSTLVALADQTGANATQKRREALAVLRKGRSDDGGWGLYPNDPPTIFDTAIALLALQRVDSPEHVGWIADGRLFLIRFQNADGSWPETTRPTGGVSYAQRVSTTAWATLALMATDQVAPR
jgi:hypothetical protein